MSSLHEKIFPNLTNHLNLLNAVIHIYETKRKNSTPTSFIKLK